MRGSSRYKRGLGSRVGHLIPKAEDWLIRFLPGLGIEAQVHHTIAPDGTNRLAINHLIPEGEIGDHVAFRVTTKPLILPSAQFADRHVREEIHQASFVRGRAIFCVRQDADEIVAAISYHVPDQGRVTVRAIALRMDGIEGRLWAESRWALVVSKAYLHVFAEKAGRGADLTYEADTQLKIREAVDYLGFRAGRRPTGFRLSGRALLVQPKLGR